MPGRARAPSGPSRAILLCALATAGACGRSADVPALSVRDSAGVRIVESAAPRSAALGWTVGAALADIGGDGSELSQVAGAVHLSDGRLVVADGGASRIGYFDASGTALREVGGPGEGPGEFSLIESLGVGAGDSVWVYDFSTSRVTIFGPRGELARSVTLQPPVRSGAAVGRRPDGSFVFAERWSSARMAEGDEVGLVREPVAYMLYDAGGRLRDTLLLSAGREVSVRSEGGRLTMGRAPFGHTSSHAMSPAGLFVGDQMAYEFGVYGFDGELTGLVRWRGADLALSDDDISDWKEELVSQAPAADRPGVRQYLLDVSVPERRPAYSRLVADEAGGVWVGAYAQPGEDPTSWDAFGVDGAWLGALQVPPRLRVLQVGADWILGVSRDALDVEHVVLLSLARGAGTNGGG